VSILKPRTIRLKKGFKITHKGFKNKDIFLYYVPANKYPANRNENKTMIGEFPDNLVPYGAYIAIKTAEGTIEPYCFTQSDISRNDWFML